MPFACTEMMPRIPSPSASKNALPFRKPQKNPDQEPATTAANPQRTHPKPILMRTQLQPSWRHLRPRQYDPIAAAAAVTRTRQRHYRPPGTRSPRRGDLPIDRHAISLLEELFPAETRKPSASATAVTRKPRREIPTQPLEQLLSPGLEEEVEQREGQKRREEEERQRQRAESETVERERYVNSAVLVLRNAGRNLVEEDFRRIVPGGRHIEGWGDSDLLKVIRSRDLRTLEPDGNYILLFRTASSAQSYERHAKQLHLLSQAHLPVPGDLTPPLPPAPLALSPTTLTDGYTPPRAAPRGKTSTHRANSDPDLSPALESTSLYGALNSYALLPATNRLDLRAAQQPHPPLLHTILRHGNYEILVHDRHPGAAAEVLLSVARGWCPGVEDVRRAVLRDGRARGLQWRVVREEGGVSRAEQGGRRVGAAVREVRIKLDGKAMVRAADGDAAAAGVEASGGAEASVVDDAASADAMGFGERHRSKTERWRRRHRRKWIVSFREADEARRFVTAWHRRDVTALLGEMVPDGENVVVNADVI